MGFMKQINDLLPNSYTVNSKDKSNSTVNSLSEKIEQLIENENITPEGVAKMLCEALGDPESYDYYFLLAQNNPYPRLLEASSITKDAFIRGKIRTKRAIYFQAILRRWGLKVKFKGEKYEG